MFALLAAAGAVWAVAQPPLTGPDEGDQVHRAAAVVRGQLVGDPSGEPPPNQNVLKRIEVPEALRDAGSCFVDYDQSPVDGALLLADVPCSDLDGGSDLVEVTTVQYRGQPTLYALLGLPTLLWPDGTGVLAGRLVGVAIGAALLASALAAARTLGRSPLLPAAVLAGITPVTLSLVASTNPGGTEIAAALALWTSTLALALAPAITGRMVARAGVALLVLSLSRGLSPLFVAVIVTVAALIATPGRRRGLVARADTRWWAGAGVAALAASFGWLGYIQLAHPLAGRPGIGVGGALGQVDWYTRQTIAVFGANDVVAPPIATVAWVGVLLVLFVVCGRHLSTPHRLLTAAVALGSFAVNITAEGLSLPPIGYFWQGRYVLPLLVGAPILAAALATASRSDRGTPRRGDRGRGRGADVPVAPGEEAAAPRTGGARARRPLALALAGTMVAVHGFCFAYAARHWAGEGDGGLGWLEALREPIWTPPLMPTWAWTSAYVLALAAASIIALRPAPAAASTTGDIAPSTVAPLGRSAPQAHR